jgi:hypothetical protein
MLQAFFYEVGVENCRRVSRQSPIKVGAVAWHKSRVQAVYRGDEKQSFR